MDKIILFLYGGMAGGIGVTSVYPIDLIKTRMQNQIGNDKYRSSFHCFMKTLKNEGFLALYKGLRPQIMGVVPEKAIKLAVNDIVKSYCKKDSVISDIISGGCAGLSQVIVSNPLEITKIRMQMSGESSKPADFKKIVSDLGFRGLYKGLPACMARDIFFSAIYFSVYSAVRKRMMKEGDITNTGQLISGTFAGFCASSVTTPLDVIKTRIQVGNRYSGIYDCFNRMIKYEGYKSLFKGFVPRVLRSSPQFGVTLYFYEKFKS